MTMTKSAAGNRTVTLLRRLRQRYPRLHGWSERTVGRLLRCIRRLQRHPNRWVRRALGVGLIAGGFLWFLPILGAWMLPLGLVVLSDETKYLRRPRRRLLVWLGRRYPACRALLAARPTPA